MGTSQRRWIAPIAVIGVAGFALAGCSGGPGSTGGGGETGGADDNVVTVYGTIADTEAELLEQSWADWEEENGIDDQVRVVQGVRGADRRARQGGNAPDLAIFPQPGLMADMANRDYLEARSRSGGRERRRSTGPRTGRTTPPSTARSTAHRSWPASRAGSGTRPSYFAENGVRGSRPTGTGLLDLTAQIQADTGTRAVVHRLRLGRRDRLAGHRLDRGPRPASGRPRRLRPVGRQRGALHRPADRSRRSTSSARSPSTPTTSTPASATSTRS